MRDPQSAGDLLFGECERFCSRLPNVPCHEDAFIGERHRARELASSSPVRMRIEHAGMLQLRAKHGSSRPSSGHRWSHCSRVNGRSFHPTVCMPRPNGSTVNAWVRSMTFSSFSWILRSSLRSNSCKFPWAVRLLSSGDFFHPSFKHHVNMNVPERIGKTNSPLGFDTAEHDIRLRSAAPSFERLSVLTQHLEKDVIGQRNLPDHLIPAEQRRPGITKFIVRDRRNREEPDRHKGCTSWPEIHAGCLSSIALAFRSAQTFCTDTSRFAPARSASCLFEYPIISPLSTERNTRLEISGSRSNVSSRDVSPRLAMASEKKIIRICPPFVSG